MSNSPTMPFGAGFIVVACLNRFYRYNPSDDSWTYLGEAKKHDTVHAATRVRRSLLVK